MSTIFGIFLKDGVLVEHYDQDKDYQSPEDDIESIQIAFRSNGGVISFYNPIYRYLDPNIKVYAFDNSPQGIYTIEDLLNEI